MKKNKKSISIIGTVGIPAKYGGFETLTEHLVENLSDKYNITVYCSSKLYKNKLKSYKGARLKYINLNANGIQSILYDIVSIFKSLKNSDTLLILGVSGCVVLPLVRLVSKKRIIINIDGLEWKRAKWNKYAKWFLKLSEKLAVLNASIVVSDNKIIKDYVKQTYNKESVLIAYGGDHVKKIELSEDLIKKYPFLKEKYAFTVCRIEPENNIHLILEAFSKYKQLNIVIIGNWNNSIYGKNLKEKYGNIKNIYLLDPIYDQIILDQIRSNCYIYIHGHSAGGTNPSLVEAMYLGLPIFAYGVSYNKETTFYKAKYFNSSKELIFLLENIEEKELKNIGKNMEKIAKENYTWENISKQYSNLF